MKRLALRFFAALVCAALLVILLAPSASAAVYWGSRGETVRQVQKKLRQWGYYDGDVDGVFGQGTRSAIMAFQAAKGLPCTGVASAEIQEMIEKEYNAR